MVVRCLIKHPSMAGAVPTLQHEMDAGEDVRHRKALKKARLATAAHVRKARQRKIRVKAARIGGVNQNQILQAIQDLSDRMDTQLKQQSKCLCFVGLFAFNLDLFCYPLVCFKPESLSPLQPESY